MIVGQFAQKKSTKILLPEPYNTILYYIKVLGQSRKAHTKNFKAYWSKVKAFREEKERERM